MLLCYVHIMSPALGTIYMPNYPLCRDSWCFHFLFVCVYVFFRDGTLTTVWPYVTGNSMREWLHKTRSFVIVRHLTLVLLNIRTYTICQLELFLHFRWVPCNHGMARPQVADGGDALQYGRQLRIYWISSRGQPTRVGPPAWGLGVGLITPHRKK
jgi:hypothetical protein